MKMIALLLLAPLWLLGSDIQWSGSFSEAQAKAKQESKPLMVLITSEQCRWCRKFEATTLQDEDIVTTLDSKFVTVHVTRDKSIYPKTLTAKMVPMHYFLDGEGKVIYSIPGYWPSEDYQSILEDVLRKAKK